MRPPEPGWPSPRADMPKEMMTALPKFGRAPNAPKPPEDGAGQWGVLLSGQDRATYSDAIRDWAAKGADERVRPQPRRGRRPVAATFGRDVGGRGPLRAGQPSVARRSDATRRSPTSSSATGCSPTTGPTSVRPGRSSATSASAATTAGGRRRRSRARRPTGRSSRTSAPTSRRSRSAATTRRPSDPVVRIDPEPAVSGQVPQNVW